MKSDFINMNGKIPPEALAENTAQSALRAAGFYPLNRQKALDRYRKSALGILVEAPEQPDSFCTPSLMNVDPCDSNYATLSSVHLSESQKVAAENITDRKAARAAHTRYLEAETNATNNLEDESTTALFEEACCEDEQATAWAESCEPIASESRTTFEKTSNHLKSLKDVGRQGNRSSKSPGLETNVAVVQGLVASSDDPKNGNMSSDSEDI
ncbi:hypothetical protein K3495_g6692 [Podosphaera aphanis]|nr:hypothetical protein K3495_g6692 [Podosphaera aphanis]